MINDRLLVCTVQRLKPVGDKVHDIAIVSNAFRVPRFTQIEDGTHHRVQALIKNGCRLVPDGMGGQRNTDGADQWDIVQNAVGIREQ